MLKNIQTVSKDKVTSYTDISDEIRKVKHSVVIDADNKQDAEERIVDDLQKVFTYRISQ